jgi:dCTP deaminase
VSLLTKEDLLEALDAPLGRRLVVTPMLDRKRQVGAASIDVRLGPSFLRLRRTESAALDPGKAQLGPLPGSEIYEQMEVPFGASLSLHPGDLLLGATLEYLRLPNNLGAYVIGRSSWGRLGLIVATAIMIQPGFAGCLTLELVNGGANPLHLYPGARVAQLAVHRTDEDTKQPYRGAYEAPIGPEIPQLARDQREIEWMRCLRTRLDAVTRGPSDDAAS